MWLILDLGCVEKQLLGHLPSAAEGWVARRWLEVCSCLIVSSWDRSHCQFFFIRHLLDDTTPTLRSTVSEDSVHNEPCQKEENFEQTI